MEENLHKDNLEEYFKKSFENENSDPSDDNWDAPSDTVWHGINEKINPADPSSSAPASIFNLKWILGIAASILIIGLVYYNFTLHKQVDDLTEVVENQKNTIEYFEKLALEKKNDQRIEEGLKGTEERENVVKEEEGSTLEEREEGKNIEEFSGFSFENNDIETSKNSASQNSSKTISKQNIQNTETGLSQIEENESSNDSQLVQSPENTSILKESIPGTDMKTKNSSSDIANSSQPNAESTSKQNHQNAIVDNPSETKKSTVKTVAPLTPKMFLAGTNLPEKEIILDLLPISEETFKPSISSSSKAGFYAGIHLAPTYGYRNIKSINGPVHRRLLNEKEQAIYSVAVGFKAGYEFSRNWSVETGLNYYKNSIESKHLAQLRYESQIEHLNSDGNYDSNYQLKLATSYGDIETDIALTRSSTTQIDQNDYINLALRTRQELKTLGVPIAIRYRTAGNKLHFSAKAGIAANFILQKDVKIKAATVNRHGVHHRRTLVDRKFSDSKNTTIDFLFGLGLDYDISKNLSIYFEPTATHSLNPVYRLNGKIKTYPIIASLNIGLMHQF